MRVDLRLALFAWVLLRLLALLCCRFWPGGKRAPAVPNPPKRKRQPKPCAGHTLTPDGPACEQEAGLPPSAAAPHAPPPRMLVTQGRRRSGETTSHVCPHATCAYHGRVVVGNLRANGPPKGRRWRHLGCLGGHRHVLETHGTPLHGKQVEPDKRVGAMGALAEGLGIHAVARGFTTDPPTVLGWLVEAADHPEAFSRHVGHDLDVEPGQRDERFAVLRAVQDGEGSEQQASKRL